MVKITGVYEGSLHCRMKHGPSGMELTTDAPKDNMGKGESFSPTDLTATSLGACMMTIMGIFAQRQNLDLAGTTFEVDKEMTTEGERKIKKLTVRFILPAAVPQETRVKLERAALTCPVHKSLSQEIEIPVEFKYQ